MAREFYACPEVQSYFAMSPKLDVVAARWPTFDVDNEGCWEDYQEALEAGLIEDESLALKVKLALLPAVGRRVNLQQLLEADCQIIPLPSDDQHMFESVRCDLPVKLMAAQLWPFLAASLAERVPALLCIYRHASHRQ